jgi:hypothetical protein
MPKKGFGQLISTIAVAGIIGLSACSPKPSDDEIRQHLNSQLNLPKTELIYPEYTKTFDFKVNESPEVDPRKICDEQFSEISRDPNIPLSEAEVRPYAALVQTRAAKLVGSKGKEIYLPHEERVLDQAATNKEIERRRNCAGLLCIAIGSPEVYTVIETSVLDRVQIKCTTTISVPELRKLRAIIEVKPSTLGELRKDPDLKFQRDLLLFSMFGDAEKVILRISRKTQEMKDVKYKISDVGESNGQKYRYVDYNATVIPHEYDFSDFLLETVRPEIETSGRLKLIYDAADKSWVER